MSPTYRISEDKRSIACLICGRISHNANDVAHRFCGNCNIFHDDLEACLWCDEAILPGERYETINYFDGQRSGMHKEHIECAMRAVVGGLNHQLGLCSCCGGKLPPDPPEMTRRQAALAAAEHFLKTHPRHGCE